MIKDYIILLNIALSFWRSNVKSHDLKVFSATRLKSSIYYLFICYQSGAACCTSETSFPRTRHVSSSPVDRPSVRGQRRRRLAAATSTDECSDDERRKWIVTVFMRCTRSTYSTRRSVCSCSRAKNIVKCISVWIYIKSAPSCELPQDSLASRRRVNIHGKYSYE